MNKSSVYMSDELLAKVALACARLAVASCALLAVVIALAMSLDIAGKWPSGNHLEPCVTEDQETPCFWDASERGNGKGSDFVVGF